MQDSATKKRVRDDSLDSFNSDADSPDAKRIPHGLLDIFDDAGSDLPDPAIQGLDSVIRSFEEEILFPAPASDSGDSRMDIGYLLGASDGELGLPPTNIVEGDLTAVSSDVAGVNGILGFEDEIPSFDSFEFGMEDGTVLNEMKDGEFVNLGGLFEYCDEERCEGSDIEVLWRPESLPAV